jgi:hypothetical protein
MKKHLEEALKAQKLKSPAPIAARLAYLKSKQTQPSKAAI